MPTTSDGATWERVCGGCAVASVVDAGARGAGLGNLLVGIVEALTGRPGEAASRFVMGVGEMAAQGLGGLRKAQPKPKRQVS